MKKVVADPARLKELGRASLSYVKTWSPERNIAATVDAIRMASARLNQNSAKMLSDYAAPKSRASASQKTQE